MSKEEIRIHTLRAYSDDFEEDQAIRFGRIALIEQLGQIEKEINKCEEKMNSLEDAKFNIESQLEEFEKRYFRGGE